MTLPPSAPLPPVTPVSSVIPPVARMPAFDPRSVPVSGIDTHLPAVPLAAQTPEALRERFARTMEWTPEVVLERSFTDRTPAHAAVLVPIVLRERPTVLLTERTAHLSQHSGQVAFPVGPAARAMPTRLPRHCARPGKRWAWKPASSRCWAPCPPT